MKTTHGKRRRLLTSCPTIEHLATRLSHLSYHDIDCLVRWLWSLNQNAWRDDKIKRLGSHFPTYKEYAAVARKIIREVMALLEGNRIAGTTFYLTEWPRRRRVPVIGGKIDTCPVCGKNGILDEFPEPEPDRTWRLYGHRDVVFRSIGTCTHEVYVHSGVISTPVLFCSWDARWLIVSQEGVAMTMRQPIKPGEPGQVDLLLQNIRETAINKVQVWPSWTSASRVVQEFETRSWVHKFV